MDSWVALWGTRCTHLRLLCIGNRLAGDRLDLDGPVPAAADRISFCCRGGPGFGGAIGTVLVTASLYFVPKYWLVGLVCGSDHRASVCVADFGMEWVGWEILVSRPTV